VLADPGEGALHHPAAGQHLEGVSVAFADHLDGQVEGARGPGHQLAGIAGIRPGEPDVAAAGAQPPQQRLRAVAVLDGCGVTTTASSSPRTSTAMWRLRPLTFLPLSQPRLVRATVSAARTDWESMTAADGAGLRPAATRTCSRRASWMASRVPSVRQRAKYPYTVRHGGYSPGRYRQAHPARTTYKIASTITRREWTAGRPRLPANGAGTSGAITAHWRSVRSDGYRLPALAGASAHVTWARPGPIVFLIVTNRDHGPAPCSHPGRHAALRADPSRPAHAPSPCRGSLV
jgi:hypothetical protein